MIQSFSVTGRVGRVEDRTGGQCAKGDGLFQLFIDMTCIFLILSVQVQGKAVTVEAIGQVDCRDVFFKYLGKLFEQVIAVGAAVFDVDVLEIVETEDHQAAALAAV